MKNLLLLLITCCLNLFAHAQTTDSIDNIVLKIPASWQINKQSSFTELKFFDNSKKSFCQLVIYGQQPSSANKQKDFEKEWKELVDKNFTVITIVKPVTIKDKKGNSFVRYGAKGIGGDGNKYFIQLNMYDCGSANQSVVAVSKTKEQLQQYDSLWQSLIVKTKKVNGIVAQNAPAQNPPLGTVDSVLVGKWGKSASGPPQYDAKGVLVNLTHNGYNKGEYNLKSNGTYTFQGERWDGYYNSEEFHLTDEKGVYSITGNQLMISPTAGIFRTVKRDGSVKKSQNLSLAKRTYTWQKHYYSGINETSLILTTDKENMVDGGFSPSELFSKSFIYSPDKVLEFRFLPLYK